MENYFESPKPDPEDKNKKDKNPNTLDLTSFLIIMFILLGVLYWIFKEAIK